MPWHALAHVPHGGAAGVGFGLSFWLRGVLGAALRPSTPPLALRVPPLARGAWLP